VKIPCRICTYDHLIHLCPKLEEFAKLLSQPPDVLNNPFIHNQHMELSSSNVVNALNRNQNPSMHEGDRLYVNMVKS
jgi:hypothetical protein